MVKLKRIYEEAEIRANKNLFNQLKEIVKKRKNVPRTRASSVRDCAINGSLARFLVANKPYLIFDLGSGLEIVGE